MQEYDPLPTHATPFTRAPLPLTRRSRKSRHTQTRRCTHKALHTHKAVRGHCRSLIIQGGLNRSYYLRGGGGSPHIKRSGPFVKRSEL